MKYRLTVYPPNGEYHLTVIEADQYSISYAGPDNTTSISFRNTGEEEHHRTLIGHGMSFSLAIQQVGPTDAQKLGEAIVGVAQRLGICPADTPLTGLLQLLTDIEGMAE